MRRLVLRLHQRTDGMSLEEIRTEPDGADPSDWLDEGEQAGMLSRTPSVTADGTEIVRLTDLGHQGAATYLRELARELTALYDGIDLEHVAVAQDACWRIILNYQRLASR